MARSGPRIQLTLKRETRRKDGIFSHLFWENRQWVSREREERNFSFSLRSTKIRWSESVEPRFKVHLLDEGYAWVPTTCSFTEDFEVWRRKYSERSSTLSLRFMAIGGSFPSGQDLKSEYSSRAMRGHRNQEFSSKIQAEVREGRGSRVFGTPKSFVFTLRGREPSYSGLYFI